MSINLRRGRFASWCRKNGLFCAIVSWIFLAIIAYTLLSAIWGDGRGWNRILTGWHIGSTHDPLDRIKVTLTALGGVGAVGYLVIKYRERAALERGEADEKLVRAVQQLGDSSPQVRIAGVYALADVADTYEGPYHQRVVDILCGYLRTDRLLKDANGDTRNATNNDGTLNYDRPLSADGAVESTILTVLATHLRSTTEADINENADPGPWSHCNLDLHRVTLTEALNFFGAHIGRLDAQDARFLGHTNFQQVAFTEDATFIGATFEQEANFDSAKFRQDSHFGNAIFKQTSQFTGVTFAQNAHFEQSTFKGAANFWNSTFERIALFSNSTFMGAAFFISSTFMQYATFDYVTFKRYAHYEGVDFRQQVSFLKSNFNSNMSDMFELFHPNEYLLEEDGLPEGAKRVDFGDDSFPLRQRGKRSINEHSQPDEISPVSDLPQDKGGEEEGDK